jgi:non-canonical (house-cleaning) NTP pyrophosphatase
MQKADRKRKIVIAVGSANPNKVRGIRKAAKRLFANAKVVGIDVDSSVSDQPFNEETIRGAVNRAKEV